MGKASDYCNCRYKHCLCPENNPFPRIEAVRVGNVFYHKDCYELKETVSKIIDYFVKEINSDVVYPVLMRTIDNILFPKDKPGIPAERLLFQMKHYHKRGGNIRYPGGLYYAIQDRQSFDAYKKYKAEKKLRNQSMSFKIDDDRKVREYDYKIRIKKQPSFEDILHESVTHE